MRRGLWDVTSRTIEIALAPLTWSLGAAGLALKARVPSLRMDADLLRHYQDYSRIFVRGNGPPLYRELADLQANARELFQGGAEDVVVVDGFYEDPDAVRRLALEAPYVVYGPGWRASALEVWDNPLKGRGVRHAGASVKARLAEITGSTPEDATWETAGDGWNGAFHCMTPSWSPTTVPSWIGRGLGSIHNHAGRDEDVRDGWSGVVYLSPNADPASGTTLWRSRATGKCFSEVSLYDNVYSRYELAYQAENVYNRAVLFRGSVLHRSEGGFGRDIASGRLTQTFFFNIQR